MAIRIKKQEKNSAPSNENKNTARETISAFDESLTRLEEDIRRLKIEFDIYFNGASKRPPYDTKNRVETNIKRLADERQLTFAQRYRYNSLVARFTSFREMWRRALQEREEGRDAVTVKHAALEKMQTEAKKEKSNASFVCDDVRHDIQTVKDLYTALIDAKRQCGESSDDLTFARFHRVIVEQAETLKQRLNCRSIRFSVGVNDGRVSFKAEAD